MYPKVLVLMSAYNGEKYIKEQIESILNQTNVEVSLLIRDDGSKDKTCCIIEEFCDSRIKLIHGTNMGATKSFLELIKLSNHSDYYAFADQDDVWDEDKLEVAIAQIHHINVPALYSSNAKLVDANLNYLGVKKGSPKTSLGSAVIANYVAGCTAVFNDALMEYLKKDSPKYTPFHDWWINLVCLSVGGKSVFDCEPHINYRQHGNNVVGATGGVINKWKNRLHKFMTESYHRDKIAEELLRIYKNDVTVTNKDILLDIKNYQNHKWKVIRNTSLRTNRAIDNLMFWICVLTNKA